MSEKRIRKAFTMKLKAGFEEEYERRHNPIWPELERVLKEHGAHRYAIFLEPETGVLFGCVEIESEERWAAVARAEVCRRWWAHMAELMETHPDNSPVARELRGVFYLE